MPVLLVGLGGDIVFRAPVPVAAIDEHGDAVAREYDVGGPP